MPTDDLGRILRESDPWSGDVEPALTRDVHAQIVAADRTLGARARTRRRRVATIAAAGLLIGVPTAAVAGVHFAAQTGFFGSPGMTEEDTSEWIDVCADDFPAYFATLPTPSESPPEGYTWAQVRHRILKEKRSANVDSCPPNGPGVMEQVTGLQSSYYSWAELTWTCRAVAAHEQHDPVGFRSNARRAAAMMDRLDELGIFGDDNWRVFRDALASGDFTVIDEYYDANATTSGCP